MKNRFFILIFLFSIMILSPIMIAKIMPTTNAESEESLELPKMVASEDLAQGVSQTIKPEVEVLENKKEELKVDSRLGEKVNIEKPKENIKKVKEKVEVPKKSAAGNSYFDDALFIGDSRTVGIAEYGGIKNATYFANTGMSVYNLAKTKVNVDDLGKVTLDELLASYKFGKVYILLGINEMGYDLDKTASKYRELVNKIQSNQEGVIIYIQANLHVTETKSKSSSTFSNTRINSLNDKLAQIANNQNIFYININEKFDDEKGNLPSNYSQDGVHIYAKYYKDWTNWIAENITR